MNLPILALLLGGGLLVASQSTNNSKQPVSILPIPYFYSTKHFNPVVRLEKGELIENSKSSKTINYIVNHMLFASNGQITNQYNNIFTANQTNLTVHLVNYYFLVLFNGDRDYYLEALKWLYTKNSKLINQIYNQYIDILLNQDTIPKPEKDLLIQDLPNIYSNYYKLLTLAGISEQNFPKKI